ncbi:helix-turn-helix transcriptional regulator [Actinomadura meridiana]|uniref:Helix-turn-helix transcriptional regulator n=1 Tax=Actinomadura meridiana TaxID=559626 RepID=A0ABP8BSQ9_9ACTN
MPPAKRQRVTLRSHWLGQHLRELREENGLLLKEVADYLQRDVGTVSRFETGFYPIRRPDLLAMLDLYGVSKREHRETLLYFSADIWQKGWWDGYAKDVEGTFVDYAWLETRTSWIRVYEAIVVHGLFQTPEYAERVIRAHEPGADDKQVRRWLELRLTRQRIIGAEDGPNLSMVLDEAVLGRRVGTRATMAAQLRHLAEVAALPSIDVRVLPLDAGTPATPGGAFVLFEMPDPFPDVAYTETLSGGVYVETPDLDAYVHAYDVRKDLALGPVESLNLINAKAEDWR